MIVSYGGSKTFYLSVKISGRPQRIKLGKFPDTTVEQARKLVTDNRSLINQGKNPHAEKRKISQGITFKELFDSFIEKHALKNNKPKTIGEYQRGLDRYLTPFINKKISHITKEDVDKINHKNT